jgi:uncharacterized membrane protein
MPQYLPKILFDLSSVIPGSGVILILLIMLITGILVNNFIGRKLLQHHF